jgi:hypothetical protein|tara:strand:- start:1078 stop:1857 length:780 start_codon:yes stop_codon:yes gene_type:complete
MANIRRNTSYGAGTYGEPNYSAGCCEWCDDNARGNAIKYPPVGCNDAMCSDPTFASGCSGKGYGQITSRPTVNPFPVQGPEEHNFNGWHAAGGVTLSQHGDSDQSFPGWQESFGAGTFLGNDDFPNDDASHIAIDDGYTATLREHGPSDSRYPGNEYTYSGPTSLNLDNFNDELSEMTVSQAPTTPVVPVPISDPIVIHDDPIPLEPVTPIVQLPTMPNDTPGVSTTTAGVAGESNTMMYVMGAAVVGLLAWYLLKNKK